MNRQEQRIKLWCDVYVLASNSVGQNSSDPSAIAGYALQDFDKTFPENGKAEKESGDVAIPEGCRLMAVGEVIRNGDKFFKNGEWRLWVESIGLDIEANDSQFRPITPI